MPKFKNSWGIHMRQGLTWKYLKPVRRRVTGSGWVRLQGQLWKGNDPHGGRGQVCETEWPVSGWAMGWQVKTIVL